MFIDARNIPAGTQLDCDVVVVGAGAGGMAAAHEFLNSNLNTIILEAGGLRREADTQDLYKGEVLDTAHHGPLDKYRQRRYGGTTTVWGGRCGPNDGIDFEARPYVPHSGWPVTRKEMDQYYKRAHGPLEAGDYTYNVADGLPKPNAQLIPGLQSDEVLQDQFWRFSLPANFAKLHLEEFKQAQHVHVHLHANCLHVQLNKEGNHVIGLRVASLQRNEFTVRAKHYVLAAGGLEVTRLLLASRDVSPNGIGNDRDLLGRFYVSHVAGDLCMATFTPRGGPIIWDYERAHDGVYCRRNLRISEAVQCREQLLNFRCILSHPPMADPAHRHPILSAGYLVKHFLIDKIPPEYDTALAGYMTPYRRAGEHAKNVLLGAPQLVGFSWTWLTKRILARRKLPSISICNKNNVYDLHFDAEQSPNPDSRVMLGDQKDALGVPRLRVDWRTTPQDVESVVKCFRILKRAFEQSGVAKLHATEEEIAKLKAGVGSHHFGTTRMASDPSRGVVDSNCCVFGTDNLFIATSSAFPTSSFANPTLSIVAFAIRVADHVKELCRRG